MSTLTLQFPEELLAGAQALAEREHISLEEYVLRVLAEQVSGEATWQRFVDQGRHVARDRFLEILRKAPDTAALPGDELD